jgi:acetyl-CoA carboxylase carboxyltransferase component
MLDSGSTIGQVSEEGGELPAGSTAAAPQGATLRSERDRIEALLDDGSFAELDRLDVGPGAGAVVGVGAIDGRDVALYAMDVAGLTDVAAMKVVKIQELALRSRIPLVGLHARVVDALPEELAALAGLADVVERHVRASGAIPQVSLVPGPQPEGIHPSALTDFVLDLAEAAGVRSLLSYLPAHRGEAPPFVPTADPAGRGDPEVQAIVAAGARPSDMSDVVARLLDDRRFLEVHAGSGPGLLTGFGRLRGHTVGVVANQPAVGDGAIDGPGAARAARFIRFCDAFGVPLLTIVDTPGPVSPGRDHARLLSAYAEATVPKLAVVAGRAVAGGYLLMAPRQLGTDLSLAWPTAAVGSGDPYAAAERGYVDDVVEPRDTRRALVRGLELCLRKTVESPSR